MVTCPVAQMASRRLAAITATTTITPSPFYYAPNAPNANATILLRQVFLFLPALTSVPLVGHIFLHILEGRTRVSESLLFWIRGPNRHKSWITDACMGTLSFLEFSSLALNHRCQVWWVVLRLGYWEAVDSEVGIGTSIGTKYLWIVSECAVEWTHNPWGHRGYRLVCTYRSSTWAYFWAGAGEPASIFAIFYHRFKVNCTNSPVLRERLLNAVLHYNTCHL